MIWNLQQKTLQKNSMLFWSWFILQRNLMDFFLWKSFFKNSPTLKLEIEFHSHKKFHQNSKIAHIYKSWTFSVLSFRKIQPFCFGREGGNRSVAHDLFSSGERTNLAREVKFGHFQIHRTSSSNFTWEFLLNLIWIHFTKNYHVKIISDLQQ